MILLLQDLGSSRHLMFLDLQIYHLSLQPCHFWGPRHEMHKCSISTNCHQLSWESSKPNPSPLPEKNVWCSCVHSSQSEFLFPTTSPTMIWLFRANSRQPDWSKIIHLRSIIGKEEAQWAAHFGCYVEASKRNSESKVVSLRDQKGISFLFSPGQNSGIPGQSWPRSSLKAPLLFPCARSRLKKEI